MQSSQRQAAPAVAPVQDAEAAVGTTGMGNAALAADAALGEAGPIELPLWDAVVTGESTTTTDEGERALAGANARWEGTQDVLARAENRGGQWFVVLDRFNMRLRFWLNSGTAWNTIDQFPGGAYVDWFNMPEGSRTHERAECAGVAALWDQAETSVRAGIAAGFATRAEAAANYTAVSNAAYAIYLPAQRAISSHANPLGPNAEWAYYQAEHARHAAAPAPRAP
jgi:hypothetical protein